MDLSYFRRSSRRGAALGEQAEVPAIRDAEGEGEPVGRELIGQELVPVIPLTPSAEGGVANGGSPRQEEALEVYTGQVVAENVEVSVVRQTMLQASPGQDLQTMMEGGAMAGTRPMATSMALSPGLPVQDDHGQGQGQGAWPGGPMAEAPQSFGPVPGTVDPRLAQGRGPLFDFQQLRRLQDLQDEAPQLYGGLLPAVQVAQRPDFLQEEEALRRRLAELQEWKKRVEAEQKVTDEQKEIEKVREENMRLKEMVNRLLIQEKKTPEKTVCYPGCAG